MDRFKDKIALVTGSTRGIGAAIATLLAQQGAKAVIHGRDTAALCLASTEIERTAGRVLPVTADVTKFSDMEAVRRQIEQELGPIDILAVDAGGTFTSP